MKQRGREINENKKKMRDLKERKENKIKKREEEKRDEEIYFERVEKYL